ncbi:macrophage mannose receptor 1-like isoform X2 [Leptotrombidium deliense]|uniref:Macrophage mannose receptor 1-like isoform X2 n=1 Tax=Leptotrombidium deliense TaxID=299467 RepID=A0A443S649_9ACAR|nr:macrophage mannose receptor 1-like isoform X2 [Leptotrombidium deliense]
MLSYYYPNTGTMMKFIIIPLLIFMVDGYCPEKWISHDDKCYHLFSYKANFTDAQNYCETFNATLPTIQSRQQNQFIKELLKDNWIYLNGRQKMIKSETFEWLDGTEFNYTHWHRGQPDDIEENYICCIYLLNVHGVYGKWIDTDCSDKKNPLCTVTNNSCAKNWTAFKEQCYHTVNIDMSFAKAQNYCSSLNASLVSIHSREQQTFVENFLFGHKAWLNAQQERINSETFKWLDGTDFDFTNWDLTHASPKKIHGEYVYCITMSFGFWFDWNCADKSKTLCVWDIFIQALT